MTSNEKIYAKYNYWGSDPPDTEKFYPDADSVLYDPYCENSHCSGGKPVALREAVLESERVEEARQAEREGEYAEAIEIYREILQSGEDERNVKQAVVGLARAAGALGSGFEAVISELASIAAQHPSGKVRRKAAAQWRLALVADGQYDAAIQAYEEVMAAGETLTDRLAAQTAVGEIYLTFLQDEAKARAMLEPILEDYPGHPEAYAAWMVLLDVEEGVPPPKALVEPAEEAAAEEPCEVTLETAPNPANPAIMIKFSLPQAMRAELAVYDVLGRKVRRLVPEQVRLSGQHQVSWDGQDEHGRTVASGVYLVRLTANATAYVRKVTMVR